MLNEQIRVPKISRAQLVALLVLTRLFILLIFVPTTHESPGGTTSLVSILFGYLLTVPVLIPVFLLLRDYPGMDLYQVARQLSPRLGKLAAAGFYLVCLLTVIETAAQFSIFLTSAVYPRASSFWLVLIFCGAVLYLVFLGLEAVTRTAAILLVAVCASGVLLGLGLWKFWDVLNLYSPFYEGFSAVLYSTVLCVTQNLELVALVLLVSNLNTDQIRSTFWGYHNLSNLMIWLMAFAAVVILGNDGETRSFPVYTMFALSGSNVFYRFDYILIMLWVGTSMIRAAMYLLLASRMLNELTGRRFGWQIPVLNGAIAAVAAVVVAGDIRQLRLLYLSLASGLPVYLLVVLLPTVLLAIRWKGKREPKEGRA